jgi:hypothetical protein
MRLPCNKKTPQMQKIRGGAGKAGAPHFSCKTPKTRCLSFSGQTGAISNRCKNLARPSFIRTIPSTPEFHRVMQCWLIAFTRGLSPPIGNFTLPRRPCSIVKVSIYRQRAAVNRPKITILCYNPVLFMGQNPGHWRVFSNALGRRGAYGKIRPWIFSSALNPQQRQAVTAGAGPVAGAGRPRLGQNARAGPPHRLPDQ